MVKTMPEVNIVNARISQDSAKGRSTAPSSQSTTAAMAKAPSSEYPIVNAIRSSGIRLRAWTLSWMEPTKPTMTAASEM